MSRSLPREVSLAGLADSLSAGETVFVPGASGEPVELTTLLATDTALAQGVHFVTSFVPGINARNLASAAASRHMSVFFMQPAYLADRLGGRLRFSPMSYSAIQRHLASPDTRIDAVIVQVGTPDADGRCPLGPAVEFLPTLLARDCRVLAVVNANVPDIPGAPRIALDRFERVARSHAGLASYDAGRPNRVAEQIAEHIARLIPHGATIQVGLGKIPSRLLCALSEHRQVAFHSGMLSDSLLGLLGPGVLRDEDALVTTAAVGSASLYPELPGIAGLRIAGVEHTHDPEVLAGIPRLHAINSALEVDLLGQANAELLDGRYVSGPGGLPDFAAAARRQVDGLSVIALPSTDASKRVSRVVAQLSPGTPVTVPRHDVDAIVTEYGVAMLRGADIEERARRIIAVAHPAFREALGSALRGL